ncbi:sulfite exporter TauE/SafE family protein [Arthrobacter sp. JSM 101049]|uniref:sulfite exporter TauE/SafE family protein n=1 Tax=Arthrobacter sp. JSM 101049 TaxID=929097 RepID=UPI003565BC02
MLSSILIFLAFGVLTGLTTVLFGFGGGFVIVPVVYALALASGSGQDAMLVAVATSTAVMIVNSLSASLAHWRSGRLRTDLLFPLAAYIGVGALGGALLATRVPDAVLHLLFIAYLAITIVDSLLRRGFISRSPGTVERRLGPVATSAGGLGIGAVASFLGVGGSIMTVPLLRRLGLPMATSAAMANPLSVPVSVVGAAVYALALPMGTGSLATGRLGYIDLLAMAGLLAGSLPTIAVAKRLVGRMPDRIHAIAFIALLVVVLASMLLIRPA